jgi:hypothetical protein
MKMFTTEVFWVVTLCSSGKAVASAGFLFSLPFDPEDGGDMFLRNIWLSPLNPECCVLFIVHALRISNPI